MPDSSFSLADILLDIRASEARVAVYRHVAEYVLELAEASDEELDFAEDCTLARAELAALSYLLQAGAAELNLRISRSLKTKLLGHSPVYHRGQVATVIMGEAPTPFTKKEDEKPKEGAPLGAPVSSIGT